MPQLLSRVKPSASVTLVVPRNHTLATLVGYVIGMSSQVDHELSLLLVRILGANARPALAMFDAFDSQRQQRRLLSAAAEAEFGIGTEKHRVFRAVIKTCETAQADRHKLAHWLWAYSPDLPNELLLANPQKVRRREIERVRLLEKKKDIFTYVLMTDPASRHQDSETMNKLYDADPEHILVYSYKDFVRCADNLSDALFSLFYFGYYLAPLKVNPLLSDAETRELQTSEGALQKLNSLRLFRESFLREDSSSDPSSTQPTP